MWFVFIVEKIVEKNNKINSLLISWINERTVRIFRLRTKLWRVRTWFWCGAANRPLSPKSFMEISAQKESTQSSTVFESRFKQHQHQQQQLQQHHYVNKNGLSIVHKHTSHAKTNSDQLGSCSTRARVAYLQNRPWRRSQHRITSSRHTPEETPEPEREGNQNSQRKVPTSTKIHHSSSKTTGNDYSRNQAYSAPTTSGQSTSSPLQSSTSSIRAGRCEHHPRSFNSRTPHSIRPEDENSIPDTISTSDMDKSNTSQLRQDNLHRKLFFSML